jgi:hypothetical protein
VGVKATVGTCMYCKYDVICALDSVATAPQNSEFGKDMNKRQALGYSLTSLTTNVKFHATQSVVLQEVFNIPDSFGHHAKLQRRRRNFLECQNANFEIVTACTNHFLCHRSCVTCNRDFNHSFLKN